MLAPQLSTSYNQIDSRVRRRQAAAKWRLEEQLRSGLHVEKDEDKSRIKQEISTLELRLNGHRKRKKVIEGKKDTSNIIDIYQISFSTTKHSERRKNKGKSRKKMRTVKNRTLVRSVKAREGDITAYKEGRMGYSPKNHVFVMRSEEESRLY